MRAFNYASEGYLARLTLQDNNVRSRWLSYDDSTACSFIPVITQHPAQPCSQDEGQLTVAFLRRRPILRVQWVRSGYGTDSLVASWS